MDKIKEVSKSLFMILIGVLFFSTAWISWIFLYIAVVIFCFLEPLSTWFAIRKGYKSPDPLDKRLSIFNLVTGIVLLFSPSFFPVYMYLFSGLWTLGASLLFAIDAWVRNHDGQSGAMRRMLFAIYGILIAIFLLFGRQLNIKVEILSITAGIFFILYGLENLLVFFRHHHPDSFIAKHSNLSLALPMLLSAFYPLRACISIKALQKRVNSEETTTKEQPDLWVYFYLKDTGMEIFGHVDIAYKDTIYSYGCHDPHNRRLMGTLGDGVLIVSDRESFIRTNAEVDHKIVLGYGLYLNNNEKTILERKIQELMDRTTPWHCDAELYKDDTIHDYASRMWKGSHCQFYKFTEGKFRTYFVASTNCVLLADTLIRNKELSLVTLTGFIAPGAYLSWLNQEYKAGNIKVRTIYKGQTSDISTITKY